jgi:hypothetical protein
VSDPITTSKSARESLARGLNALQADPSVPPQLAELAAPIAQAMGALHQLERTQQLAPHADVALNHVRGALAQLQTHSASHPAVNQALEAVATSLGLVHTLSKMANGPAAAAPAAPPAAPVQLKTQAMAAKPTPSAAPPQQRISSAQQPRVSASSGASAPQAAPNPSAAQAAPHASPMVSRDPFAAPAGPPATPSMPVPAPPPPAGSQQTIQADLGAHSPTNFYKGLAGNDIIDHGGLFIATYRLPKLNTAVRLKVSLPGGYEFEANAQVKWTREDGGADSPPGFGAQFTAITPEARQLVYRYVRNREPIFHDDF